MKGHSDTNLKLIYYKLHSYFIDDLYDIGLLGRYYTIINQIIIP